MYKKNISLLSFLIITLLLCNIYPCTMISASNDTLVLAGNNEDYSDPDTYFWFLNKSESRKYGGIYFGYGNHYQQGGMNDAGLCFDAFATAPNPIRVLYADDLPLIPLPPLDFVMKNCATTKEVVALMFQYDLSFMTNFQLMFTDRYGDSVIIEGEDVIWKDDYYQVCTNFYHSNPELGGYPCWRYDKAEELFEAQNDSVSIAFFKDILNATHQEGQFPTLYTNIYDLKNGLVYLYLNHFYDEVIKIDLQQGLQLGDRTYKIASQYSLLSIKSPKNYSEIEPDNIKFIWEGRGDKYKLLYSTDPKFSSYEIIEIDISDFSKKAVLPIFIITLMPFFLIQKIIINRYVKGSLILLASFILIHCSKNTISAPNNDYDISKKVNEITVTIDNLQSNTNYYWKIIAERNGPFKSESRINSFTTFTE